MIDCVDGDGMCVFYDKCPQLPIWDRVQMSMIKILEDTTLQDMINEVPRSRARINKTSLPNDNIGEYV